MNGIDVIVNNASKPEFAMFGDMTYELWQKSLENEVNNVFLVTWAALPYLIAAGGGSIVNLGLRYRRPRHRGQPPGGAQQGRPPSSV